MHDQKTFLPSEEGTEEAGVQPRPHSGGGLVSGERRVGRDGREGPGVQRSLHGSQGRHVRAEVEDGLGSGLAGGAAGVGEAKGVGGAGRQGGVAAEPVVDGLVRERKCVPNFPCIFFIQKKSTPVAH